MEENERFEKNKRLNQPFLNVFDAIQEEMNVTQQKLAELLQTSSSNISGYRKGTKKVGRDLKQRIIDLTKGRTNPKYLDGKSDNMFLPTHTEPGDASTNEHAAEMSIIELAASLIKENEALRRQLQDTIDEVKSLREEMSRDRDAIATIRTSLSDLLYRSAANTIPIAAEPDS